jgi:hypothetical protein
MHTLKQFIVLAVMYLASASTVPLVLAIQQSPPGWFIVFEEKGTAASPAQFMKAQKEGVVLWKKIFPDVPVFAWQNDDNTLNRVIPIRSFASIDTLYRKMERVSELRKAGSSKEDKNSGNLSTISGFVMMWVPELSHQSDAEFMARPGKPYTEWMFAYLLPGHEQEAAAALANFREYYIKNKLDYPWDTFRVLLGNNTPVMIGIFCAESPSALQAKGNRIWKKHGDELGRLWDEVVRHTWKIESKTGWFSQSLSNIPAIEPHERISGGL